MYRYQRPLFLFLALLPLSLTGCKGPNKAAEEPQLSVHIAQAKLVMEVGEVRQLTVDIESTFSPIVGWRIDEGADIVATSLGDGKLKALSVGEVTVTVIVKADGREVSDSVQVEGVPAKGDS